VQDERQAFGRGERLQHDQQRQSDRVRGQRLVLGVAVAVADDRVGQAYVQRLFPPGRPRAEHVQADPPGDGGQPGGQVGHVVGVGAAEPQPGLLDSVVRLGQRAEHPVRHRAQVRALLLEPLGQKLLIGHRYAPSLGIRHTTDEPNRADVTEPVSPILTWLDLFFELAPAPGRLA
jgi:hypothetical protein